MNPPTMHQIMTHLATGQHGSFAKKLAEAWFIADSGNQTLIEENWPHLIRKAIRFIETAPVTID